jgi:3-oxoacyl-[acyl-carrier-protein] synthase-3
VLLLTADTYSKLIHPMDRGVRSLFGDGAAATMIEALRPTRRPWGPSCSARTARERAT